MTTSNDGVTLFEQRHMISIILYLLDHDGSRKIDLYSGVGRGNRMPEKMDMLADAGLIDRNVLSATGRLSLTEYGRDVASKLKVLDESMREYREPTYAT